MISRLKGWRTKAKAKRRPELLRASYDSENPVPQTKTDDNPTSSSSNPDWAKTALNTTKLALEILEKTLGGVPLPALKGAIGGLLVVINTVDVSAFFFCRD
jgi:hypothetical protein